MIDEQLNTDEHRDCLEGEKTAEFKLDRYVAEVREMSPLRKRKRLV